MRSHALLVLAVLAAACGGIGSTSTGPGDGGAADPDAAASDGAFDDASLVCTSGRTSPPALLGSSHRPGESCMATGCHAPSNPELPAFVISGTVYPTLHEPDDCVGGGADASVVTVVVTDSTNTVRTLTVNAGGNFLYRGAFTPPYTAKVVMDGKENAATAPQTSGDCNSCHTAQGANGAPGRIMTP